MGAPREVRQVIGRGNETSRNNHNNGVISTNENNVGWQ